MSYFLIVVPYHVLPGIDRGGEQNVLALIMIIPHVPYFFLRSLIVGDWQPENEYVGIIETMFSLLLFGVLLALVAHWFCKGLKKSNDS